ncbi:DUF4189 domain-containing protein [Nocardia tengchongensis]|uniref:DUF4189 domain-containing protein n=1 Tax=Nocardia tengchongensis TaxID=2055889 RepID=UPI0036B400FF
MRAKYVRIHSDRGPVISCDSEGIDVDPVEVVSAGRDGRDARDDRGPGRRCRTRARRQVLRGDRRRRQRQLGFAANYPSQASADSDAMSECGGPRNCTIRGRWTDGCAALAIGLNGPYFKGIGYGETVQKAEHNAFEDLHHYTYLPPAGSSAGMHDDGYLAKSFCNG